MRYKIINQPAEWVSAHRENRYKVRLPQTTISSGYNNGGFLKLNLAGSFGEAINVGDRVYIPAGTDYTGFHTIKEVHSSIQITLETQWVSNTGGSVVIWHVYLPTISIYKGYRAGELVLTYTGGTIDLYDIMPFELVGEFKPEPDLTGYLNFDICGYLRTVIESPYKGAYNPDETNYLYSTFITGYLSWYAPKYYNKVEVFIDDTKVNVHYAANAAISTDELNREFVDTERQLQPLKQPVLLFSEYTLGDYINNLLLTAKYKV